MWKQFALRARTEAITEMLRHELLHPAKPRRWNAKILVNQPPRNLSLSLYSSRPTWCRGGSVAADATWLHKCPPRSTFTLTQSMCIRNFVIVFGCCTMHISQPVTLYQPLPVTSWKTNMNIRLTTLNILIRLLATDFGAHQAPHLSLGLTETQA